MRESRVKMKLTLRRQEIHESWNCRNISGEDVDSLGMLMLESYRGTVDYEGETLEDAISEIQATVDGKYGPLLKQCSFAIEKNEQLLSATIVTMQEDVNLPFLAFSMTHRNYRNQGMAAFLIKSSINALLAKGYRELSLVVTENNRTAVHVYQKIGFRIHE